MAESTAWAVLNSSYDPFCAYDSIDEVDDANESTVPSEPQENGRLYTYNKVPLPVTVSLKLLFGGDFATQNDALARLERFRIGTEVVTIVTPARVYSNMALVSYSTTRASTNGVGMLEVSCNFQEILNAQLSTETVQWTPKNATSADNVNRGQVQGTEVDESLAHGLVGAVLQ